MAVAESKAKLSRRRVCRPSGVFCEIADVPQRCSVFFCLWLDSFCQCPLFLRGRLHVTVLLCCCVLPCLSCFSAMWLTLGRCSGCCTAVMNGRFHCQFSHTRNTKLMNGMVCSADGYRTLQQKQNSSRGATPEMFPHISRQRYKRINIVKTSIRLSQDCRVDLTRTLVPSSECPLPVLSGPWVAVFSMCCTLSGVNRSEHVRSKPSHSAEGTVSRQGHFGGGGCRCELLEWQ